MLARPTSAADPSVGRSPEAPARSQAQATAAPAMSPSRLVQRWSSARRFRHPRRPPEQPLQDSPPPPATNRIDRSPSRGPRCLRPAPPPARCVLNTELRESQGASDEPCGDRQPPPARRPSAPFRRDRRGRSEQQPSADSNPTVDTTAAAAHGPDSRRTSDEVRRPEPSRIFGPQNAVTSAEGSPPRSRDPSMPMPTNPARGSAATHRAKSERGRDRAAMSAAAARLGSHDDRGPEDRLHRPKLGQLEGAPAQRGDPQRLRRLPPNRRRRAPGAYGPSGGDRPNVFRASPPPPPRAVRSRGLSDSRGPAQPAHGRLRRKRRGSPAWSDDTDGTVSVRGSTLLLAFPQRGWLGELPARDVGPHQVIPGAVGADLDDVAGELVVVATSSSSHSAG